MLWNDPLQRHDRVQEISEKMTDLFKEYDQSKIDIQCLGLTFPNEDARRQHFLSILAEKLQDPSFRNAEGFPIASDKAILDLSDPPYYTACPNPFLADFLEYNSKSSTSSIDYVKVPFSADVSEGKNDAIYNAHGYHTKVPHKAIMRHMLHYTMPGDFVLDMFCGSGMSGIAAQLCGDPTEIAALGYRITTNGEILSPDRLTGKETWSRFSKLGARNVILGDLSPAATFISHSYNNPLDVLTFKRQASLVMQKLHDEFGWMYQTLHAPSASQIEKAVEQLELAGTCDFAKIGVAGKINYVVWSDVFSCPSCTTEMTFWDVAVNENEGKVRDQFDCPGCSTNLTKRTLERVWRVGSDPDTSVSYKIPKQRPVSINYVIDGKRALKKIPDAADLAILDIVDRSRINYWYPTDRIPLGDKTPEATRLGIESVNYLFTRRSLTLLSAAWSFCPSALRWAITGSMQRASKQHQIAISRVGGDKAGEGGATAGHRRGTLYIPSNQVEMSIFTLLDERFKQIIRSAKNLPRTAIVTTQSATKFDEVPSNSIDYVFIDPPFGSNIMYSELSFSWEAWLKAFTNTQHEAIENKTQLKNLEAYRQLMRRSFSEANRVLKPGRWITIEFSNTHAAVWNSIQSALSESGFVVANVSVLDKKRGGLNAIVGATAVKQDLVISAYKPDTSFSDHFAEVAGTEESAWDFVREHLKFISVFKSKADRVEFIAERDPRIIFDRMVAWFFRHGSPVPMSSKEFQSGLLQRFAEREGMIFLSDQAIEYDMKRAGYTAAPQIELFVSDERSAIDWLADYLNRRPSTYQDISPAFMAQLGAGWKKFELRPELLMLLEENFLKFDGVGDVPSQIHSYLSTNYKDFRGLRKDDATLRAKSKDRWYLPNLSKSRDLEMKRERALLKEFEDYRAHSGRKIKEARLEVLRVGFKNLWASKQYGEILRIISKLPDEVLFEDEKLLTIYDMASTRQNE